MIDRTALLEDLKRLVTRVEGDLLARSEDSQVPEIVEVLRGEYERARTAKRTADTYGAWREDRITQAAVAWVLSCVFVRFLEDNDLIAPPRIAGPGERLRQARDAHQHYFLSHPRETDREYLLSIFDELAASPGTSGIFGPHNALREIPNWLSGDTAREVIQFFQKIDANTGLIVHDFSDAAWDTRFLGDLYQDLSAFARSRYALLQTPHFIEQFLLDRTLEPAIDECGLTDSFKMIDPACGSGHLGHLVLGSFERILDRWQRSEPATPVRELVRRTLGSVHGVDINPFAVAIARFRLLLVAMRACGIKRLADAPDFRLNIECGDSLLHVPLASGHQELFDRGSSSQVDDECDHAYASEDISTVKALLQRGQYHAVMANPPYIVVRDPELNQRYRKRFSTCHRQYSLAVPFMEHIYALSTRGGFTGQITSFNILYENARQQFTRTDDDGNIIRWEEQSGESRSEGYEVRFAANFTRFWQVTGGYTYTDARVTKNPTNPGIEGRWLPRSPKHIARLTTSYNMNKLVRGLSVGGTVSFQTYSKAFETNDPYFIDEHVVVNLRANYRHQLWGKPLLYNLVVYNAFGAKYFESSIGRSNPASFRLSVDYSF